ncbi:Sugar kinase of the NBD/HSP70 family, may contain an N-terminal HTH domain [Kaistia soli DSM 19436]|uniref:Sugar kinase of the NBD/HSP70 family, may contain an N-terminal HTH domain n=1 Tax=Kaistia soli DSM 19436 TaxID=1122133 RepID=A0A1M5IEV9_9HYPH|nr:ROK family protein [Kaistia soli]SHG26353.1 Sugar kinase of the NBD/HSP70 family, may contain an N-terminal HTH domain [Kaistia soli DSM 19436]
MSVSLGVDIGGTKIQFCTIDAELRATPLGMTPTALMRRGTTAFASDLAALIRTMCPPDVQRIGLTLNGILDRGDVVYSSLMGGRVGFPLQPFLREKLGLPVFVDDDIHAMAIAEAALGAGRDGAPFAMLNLGTGIGVGVFEDGRVLRGAYAAGLISEQTVYVEELGAYRSLDRTVCGRGLREVYAEIAGEIADGVTIFERARTSEPAALQTVAIFCRYLGEAMQMISRFYHPARIVLNGSIKRSADVFLEPALQRYHSGLEPSFRAEIIVSELEHAAELGTLAGRELRDLQ